MIKKKKIVKTKQKEKKVQKDKTDEYK